jgi:hypothetical protein
MHAIVEGSENTHQQREVDAEDHLCHEDGGGGKAAQGSGIG